MNITSILEMSHSEVENILDASFIYVDEIVCENVIQTCVDGFTLNNSKENLETDEGMERLFLMLKARNIIPTTVKEFSYEISSCERIKDYNADTQVIPKLAILTFTESK